jgi:hypothetical protein
VVDRSTAKNPDDRYQTIDEMAEDLQAALEVEAIRAGGTTGEATSVLDAVAPPRRQIPTSRTSPWPAVIMLLVALVIAAGTAYFISRGDTGGGGGGGAGGGGSSEAQISLVGAADYDPQGDDEEHSEEIDFAIDDDRSASAWTTETYETDSLGDKSGVGLYVDTGEPVEATEMEVRTPTPGWTLEVYGTNDPIPDDVSGWTRLAQVPDVAEQQQIDLITAGVKYQYYLLWITDPAEIDSGFGVAISDIRLFG